MCAKIDQITKMMGNRSSKRSYMKNFRANFIDVVLNVSRCSRYH